MIDDWRAGEREPSVGRTRGHQRAQALAMLLAMVVVASTACGGRAAQRSEPTSEASTATTAIPDASGIAGGVDPAGKLLDGTIDTPDGRTRSFHLYVPASMPADHPVPLLVGLHGGGGWGTQFEDNSRFDRLAEANGFLVVYPDGVGVSALGSDEKLRTWNAGTCCGTAEQDDIDDVGFISALVDRLERDWPVDPDRVYAAGHSNGAMLSYRLACELSDKIAAVGVVSGALEIDDCAPSKAVSVIQINGTADENVPIEGGRGSKTLSGGSHPPPRDGATAIAAGDSCPDEPSVETDGDITTTTWSPCRDGSEVRFVVIEGSPHAWPGSESGPLSALTVGTPYPDYDASYEVWAFLAAHHR